MRRAFYVLLPEIDRVEYTPLNWSPYRSRVQRSMVHPSILPSVARPNDMTIAAYGSGRHSIGRRENRRHLCGQ